MNLIIESPQEVQGFAHSFVNEQTGKQEQSYYIQGIFTTVNKKNRNGRIYPRALWEREIEAYQKEINEKTINSLGEWEHPSRTSVDPMKAVMRIQELRINGDFVIGKAEILDNGLPETEQLTALFREGMKIGVSSRGVGKVGANGIVESFKLICYDAVANPSDYNANLNGIRESLIFENGIATNAEYFINESGKIEEKKLYTVDGFKFKKEFEELIRQL